jgi:transmembrane sensor
VSTSFNPAPDDPDSDEVEAAAAVWLSLRDRGMSESEMTAFMRWLEQDPQHAEVFAELDAAWQEVGRLAVIRPDNDAAPDRDLLAPRSRPRRRTGSVIAMLAAAATLAMGLFIANQPDRAPPTAETAVGAFQKIDLPDGSVVQLNTDSALDVNFAGNERLVRLIRGEAHFDVAKDPSRPFRVAVGDVSIRAIGTAFNIRLRGADVEVLVTEGRVGVESNLPKTRAPSVDLAPLHVSAGRIARVRPAQLAAAEVVEVDATHLQRALAWQERRIEFDAMPLAEVVQEFNRYNRCQLVITEPSLARKVFTGTFRADGYQAFVRILEETFSVHADRRTDEIRLHYRR